MIGIRRIFAALALAVLGAVPACAKLRVIATTPDLADLARRIGGERVVVETLAKGSEDIHAVPQRPSFLPKLNRADAVVLQGLGIEHAFLPALLEVAQNPRILSGRPGYIDCSEGLAPLEVPATLSRAEGEIHPQGNPHYNVDPRKGALIAKNIAEGFARLDPQGAAVYAGNREAFADALSKRMAVWTRTAAALKGVRAVSYHRDMAYLADFLGLSLVGELEPKPGIAPTPRHLEELSVRMKAEGVRLILREVQYPESSVRWLADRTGASVAPVATMAGAFPDSGDYFGMIEHNLRAVLDAVQKP